MIQVYKKEYNEILELLKLIPSYDYLKIPSEKIEFFEKHAIKNYNFTEITLLQKKKNQK